MFSDEARRNIAARTGDFVKELESMTAGIEKIIALASAEMDKDTRSTGGLRVAFTEWSNLVAKVGAAKQEIKRIPEEAESIYDMYDKAGLIMKVLDDIVFQMNLLRFLTGVEVPRMGDHGAPFVPIIEGLTALCESENKRKDSVIELVKEIGAQTREEMRLEAAGIVRRSVDALRAVADEGDALIKKLEALVIACGPHGKGYAGITRETIKGVSTVRETEKSFERFAEGIEVWNINSSAPADMDNKRAEIVRLEDAVFMMNVNSFNAAVESARSGFREECAECSRGVMEYVGQMQRACKNIYESNAERMKLTELIINGNYFDATRRPQKVFEDIMFQNAGLNMTLTMESARSGREDFMALAGEFEAAYEGLTDECRKADSLYQAAEAYGEKLAALIKKGHEVAEAAGPYGVCIEYIMKEYGLFNEAVKRFRE